MSGLRLALLIANDQFADTGLARLRAPQVDIASLAEVFEDPDIGGFTVKRLVNVTSQDLRVEVNKVFAQRDPDDFVLVHVSSHGLKDTSGELFLASTDTRRDQLDATAVEATYFSRQMRRSRAGAAVLLLDCCYAGAFDRGMATRADKTVDLAPFVSGDDGRGRAVIAASSAIEYAFEGPELPPDQPGIASVFSDAVVTGLRELTAQADGDGRVLLGDLYTFVSRRVRERSADQTPQWSCYDVRGDLVIARNPSPRVKALDLPSTIQDGLASTQPAARIGAVVMLRTLLHGEPGLALAAYETLQTLALDDSRQVSAEAASALADVLVTVEPTELDFGEVAVGSPARTLELVLNGSLAGACRLVPVDAPVTVSRRASLARVTLDPAAAAVGDFAGRIEVQGPGGGVAVPVRGQVSPVGPISPVSQAEPATTSARRSPLPWLLLGAWILAALTAVAGLAPLSPGSRWTFENSWFGRIRTHLPIVTLPLLVLGLQLRRDRRERALFAAGLAGAGLPPAVALLFTIDHGLHSAVLVVLVVVSLATTVVGVLLSVQLASALPGGTNRLSRPGVLVTVALAAGSTYLVVSTLVNHGPSHLGGVPVAGLLLLSFLAPLPARVRVALCGAALGAALSALLYLLPWLHWNQPGAWAAAIANLCLTVVALVSVRPAWRLLDQADVMPR